MTGGKKKGLSIGAAMKQRMDSQDEQAAPEVERAAPDSNRPLKIEMEKAITPSPSPTEIEVLESFNTRLPRGLHRRLKVYTATKGHKIQDVVAQALNEYLQRNKGKDV
ncbi:hypothetical protein [Deinococcus sp. AJ005]|uniref:hypothetical protein n=1 Tax=Deinococcus sp. AJ005 TaxID=2652443 RepID=UPI00125CD2AB|nr:hypothetical protein [Deinococcus sp. AJ005]QFP75051.1 hypothetical protein DAAJ005_00340 [Deinococcus sp. AJ005]